MSQASGPRAVRAGVANDPATPARPSETVNQAAFGCAAGFAAVPGWYRSCQYRPRALTMG